MTPYDGEKADVFASTFILLTMYANCNYFDNPASEQAGSQTYQRFTRTGHLNIFWRDRKLTPSLELQDLFAGMLQENPLERWTVKQIIDCPWMNIQEMPSTLEIETETLNIIEFFGEQIIRKPVRDKLKIEIG